MGLCVFVKYLVRTSRVHDERPFSHKNRQQTLVEVLTEAEPRRDRAVHLAKEALLVHRNLQTVRSAWREEVCVCLDDAAAGK